MDWPYLHSRSKIQGSLWLIVPSQKQSCPPSTHLTPPPSLFGCRSSWPHSVSLSQLRVPISTCPALPYIALGSCWDLGACWLQPIGLLTVAGWPCMPWPGIASASTLAWDGTLCVARLGVTGRFACVVFFPPAGTHPACPQDPLCSCPQCPQPA